MTLNPKSNQKMNKPSVNVNLSGRYCKAIVKAKSNQQEEKVCPTCGEKETPQGFYGERSFCPKCKVREVIKLGVQRKAEDVSNNQIATLARSKKANFKGPTNYSAFKGIILPEKKKTCGCEDSELGYHTKDCSFYEYGWNDCLDVVEKLNETVGVTGSPTPERAAELTADSNSSTPNPSDERWEKEFQKKYWGLCFECCDFEKLLDDIDDLLSQQKKELVEEIRKLKIGDLGNYEKIAQMLDGGASRDGFNNGVDAVIKLLTQKDKV